RAAAAGTFNVEKRNLLPIVRTMRPRRVSFQIGNFFRIRTISIHDPKLPLLFLSGAGEKRERLRVGRPSRIGISSLASNRNLNERRRRTFRCPADVGLLRG